ncbi:MAG: 50S ribosomal protein L11 methyltransferase [Thermoanaerobaculia bacterium]|nr:50S ribosomal protein L11 methyltransferase [Thermoanaerobaculia bacterium]
MSDRRSDENSGAPGESPEPSSFDPVLEISVPDDRDDLIDLVAAHLYAAGSSGSSHESAGGRTLVIAWFPDATSLAIAETQLAEVEGLTLRPSSRPRIDWLAHYEDSLVAMEIGGCFVVAPRAELIADTGRIAIVIPQEQAFGTGSHETTWMCLELLEGMELHGATGLDVGTGSGILAIAMAKLGARRVFGFDNDLADTWGVVAKNLARNGVAEGQVSYFFASAEALAPSHRFDVITMNILPHVIIQLLPDVVPSLAPSGRLITSGILVTQKDDVIAAAVTHGLKLADERTRGEWWAGAFCSAGERR